MKRQHFFPFFLFLILFQSIILVNGASSGYTTTQETITENVDLSVSNRSTILSTQYNRKGLWNLEETQENKNITDYLNVSDGTLFDNFTLVDSTSITDYDSTLGSFTSRGLQLQHNNLGSGASALYLNLLNNTYNEDIALSISAIINIKNFTTDSLINFRFTDLTGSEHYTGGIVNTGVDKFKLVSTAFGSEFTLDQDYPIHFVLHYNPNIEQLNVSVASLYDLQYESLITSKSKITDGLAMRLQLNLQDGNCQLNALDSNWLFTPYNASYNRYSQKYDYDYHSDRVLDIYNTVNESYNLHDYENQYAVDYSLNGGWTLSNEKTSTLDLESDHLHDYDFTDYGTETYGYIGNYNLWTNGSLKEGMQDLSDNSYISQNDQNVEINQTNYLNHYDCLKINNSIFVPSGVYDPILSFDMNNPVVVSFWFATNDTQDITIFRLYDSTANNIIRLTVEAGNLYNHYDGGSDNFGTILSNDEWNRIDLYLDYNLDSFDLLINNELIGDDLDGYNTIADINELRIATWKADQTLIHLDGIWSGQDFLPVNQYAHYGFESTDENTTTIGDYKLYQNGTVKDNVIDWSNSSEDIFNNYDYKFQDYQRTIPKEGIEQWGSSTNYNLDNWFNESVDDTTFTIKDQIGNRKNVIEFYDNSVAQGYKTTLDIVDSSNSEIEFYFRTTDATKQTNMFLYDNLISNSIWFNIDSGLFRYYDSGFINIAPINNNQWYKLNIDYDISSTWALTIDETTYSGLTYRGTPASINAMEIRSQAYGGDSNYYNYFDSFWFLENDTVDSISDIDKIDGWDLDRPTNTNISVVDYQNHQSVLNMTDENSTTGFQYRYPISGVDIGKVSFWLETNYSITLRIGNSIYLSWSPSNIIYYTSSGLNVLTTYNKNEMYYYEIDINSNTNLFNLTINREKYIDLPFDLGASDTTSIVFVSNYLNNADLSKTYVDAIEVSNSTIGYYAENYNSLRYIEDNSSTNALGWNQKFENYPANLTMRVNITDNTTMYVDSGINRTIAIQFNNSQIYYINNTGALISTSETYSSGFHIYSIILRENTFSFQIDGTTILENIINNFYFPSNSFLFGIETIKETNSSLQFDYISIGATLTTKIYQYRSVNAIRVKTLTHTSQTFDFKERPINPSDFSVGCVVNFPQDYWKFELTERIIGSVGIYTTPYSIALYTDNDRDGFRFHKWFNFTDVVLDMDIKFGFGKNSSNDELNIFLSNGYTFWSDSIEILVNPAYALELPTDLYFPELTMKPQNVFGSATLNGTCLWKGIFVREYDEINDFEPTYYLTETINPSTVLSYDSLSANSYSINAPSLPNDYAYYYLRINKLNITTALTNSDATNYMITTFEFPEQSFTMNLGKSEYNATDLYNYTATYQSSSSYNFNYSRAYTLYNTTSQTYTSTITIDILWTFYFEEISPSLLEMFVSFLVPLILLAIFPVIGHNQFGTKGAIIGFMGGIAILGFAQFIAIGYTIILEIIIVMIGIIYLKRRDIMNDME